MRKNFYPVVSLLFILFFHAPLFSQQFSLLKDIAESTVWSSTRGPRNMIAVNEMAFFRQDTGFWRTDGTLAGTIFLKRITPEKMVNVNGTLFLSGGTIFVYSSPGSGSSHNLDGIWKSDGTPEGTIQVKDMGEADNMTSVNNTLYFTASDVNAGNELWKSDGTEAGTVMVKDITPGPGGSSLENLINVNGTLFFNAGGALWKSDGTQGGTILVRNNTTIAYPLALSTGIFYFINNVNELWKSDGTNGGTVFIKQISTTVTSYNPGFTYANGTLFFIGNIGTADAALWKSDGTEAGTVLVKDINPGTDGIGQLIDVNGILFFIAQSDFDNTALWKSDGTTDGTIMVKNNNPSSLTNVNGILFFSGSDGPHGRELWKSDGTETGTVMIKDIYQGSGSSNPFITDARATEPPAGLGHAVVSNTLFFSAVNGLNGRELWKSDGTAAGTKMVNDIYTPNNSSNPKYFTNINGVVYFSAFDRYTSPGFIIAEELFKTDGTLSGTELVRDLFGLGNSFPGLLTNLNGTLYFSASDGTGRELFKSNGTHNGTVKVKDIKPGSSDPSNLTPVNNYLYFSANDGTNGNELWKTDGTETGTVMVKNINAAGNSNPGNLVNLNGTLYFTADDGINGIELWKSDGTEAGTVMLTNINAGSNSSDPAFLTILNGVLYFAASDGSTGVELWKSNGTSAGTVLVRNINAGIASSSPAFLKNINGILYFTADNGVGGRELWKSDGTAAGTVLVKDIYPGINGSEPASLTNINGIIYFSAANAGSGRELWKSDGTAAGTVLLKEINPAGSSNPSVLTKVGTNLLFAADDGTHGSEIWFTNGTGAGTRMMQDIEPGSTGSDPTEMIEVNAKILASAFTSYFGREVWVASAPADAPVLVATISPAGPLTICGSNVVLEANTGAGYSYQWRKGTANIAGANVSSYTATASGLYSFLITDALGNTAVSDVVIVTIASSPPATITAAGPTTFCNGKNVLLRATSAAGYTYQWKKAGVNIDNATSYVFAANASGSYSVVVTNAAGCSITSSAINVVVTSLPLATTTAAGPLTFCLGKSVLLRTNTSVAYTYQWKKGNVNIAGAVLSSYTATAAGAYNVTVTNTAGCSITSAVTTVVVNSLPAATITAAGSRTVCSGKTVLLKANSGAGYTYQWKKGTANIAGANASSYAATTTGSYYVVVTNAAGCSVTSAATEVVVNASPLAAITTTGSLVFCSGKSVLLRANTGTSYTYQWKKGSVNITGANQSTYTASASGVYFVVVTNVSGCSVTSAGKTVVVNPLPVATIAANGSLTFCSGKNVLLRTYMGAGYTYQWKKGNVNIAGATLSNYTATTPGNYTVVVTNAAGCSVTSAATNIVVNPLPAATIIAGGPLTFCADQTVLLTANTGAGYTYQWKKGNVSIIGANESTYTATTAGIYTVVVTNATGCSTISTGINVTVNPVPVATITANGPLSFPQGGSVLLKATAGSGYTYQWKKDGVNISGAVTNSFTAITSGSYTVVVTNTSGCQATSQPVEVSVTAQRPITKTFNVEEDGINVYPNPVHRNDYLTIDRHLISPDKKVLVTVSDMAGRKIHSQTLNANDKAIKITGASGMYMVEFRWGDNNRKVFKIIKVE